MHCAILNAYPNIELDTLFSM